MSRYTSSLQPLATAMIPSSLISWQCERDRSFRPLSDRAMERTPSSVTNSQKLKSNLSSFLQFARSSTPMSVTWLDPLSDSVSSSVQLSPTWKQILSSTTVQSLKSRWSNRGDRPTRLAMVDGSMAAPLLCSDESFLTNSGKRMEERWWETRFHRRVLTMARRNQKGRSCRNMRQRRRRRSVSGPAGHELSRPSQLLDAEYLSNSARHSSEQKRRTPLDLVLWY
mmetsp:Transcript_18511/g.42203  ORF Transcript_18511/g.42203 Transcript_18511/m.42203 type:complete len:224 (+) Transcript_18511:1217-1888(+)